MPRIECCGKPLETYADYQTWMSEIDAVRYAGLFWAFKREERQFQPAARHGARFNGDIHCGDSLMAEHNLYACRDCLQKAGVIW